MRNAIVAIVAVSMLGAAKPEPVAQRPDANGWSVLERPEACLLTSGDIKLAFIATDGRAVAIALPGAIGGDKAFSIDSGPISVQFRSEGGFLLAPAPDDLLLKLLQSKRIRADWPDVQIDAAPPEMRSLIELRSCGGRVAAKKAEAQQKAERRREFWQRVARAGAAMSAASAATSDESDADARSTAFRAGGGMCMKKREWTSGFNKNCVYDCLGSEAVQTIGSVELCPLTINR
jgi:hypothetical protein